MRTLLATLAGLVALIMLAGATYQVVATARAERRYTPPGRLVDVGERRLHLNCIGYGSPAVILESAAGMSSNAWALVQPAVAKVSRVCSYDRAGYGWSDNGPLARTPAEIAEELHALLANSGMFDPYVLVGDSFGAEVVSEYARKFRQEVAGLVLVAAGPEKVPDG
ncbi:MAG: alpha/beta fold hydrolase, partial [Bryobacteraceae bacterium]